MPVSQVAGVPHEAVVVGYGEQRRYHVPGLARQKVPIPSLQIEIGLPKAQNLARFAAAVLKIHLSEAPYARILVQFYGFESGTKPGQTRVHGQITIVFGIRRLRLYPEAELVALHPGIVNNGVEADKTVDREFSGKSLIYNTQQAAQYSCGNDLFQISLLNK